MLKFSYKTTVEYGTPSSAEINYLAESKFDEEIVIRTSWGSGSNIFYNHSILKQDDNKELCRIKLEWKKSSTGNS
jgi:acyl-CoA thioesterase FadM